MACMRLSLMRVLLRAGIRVDPLQDPVHVEMGDEELRIGGPKHDDARRVVRLRLADNGRQFAGQVAGHDAGGMFVVNRDRADALADIHLEKFEFRRHGDRSFRFGLQARMGILLTASRAGQVTRCAVHGCARPNRDPSPRLEAPFLASTRDSHAPFAQPPTLGNEPPPDELKQTLEMARRFDVAGRDERNRALGRVGEARVPYDERATLMGAGRRHTIKPLAWFSCSPLRRLLRLRQSGRSRYPCLQQGFRRKRPTVIEPRVPPAPKCFPQTGAVAGN